MPTEPEWMDKELRRDITAEQLHDHLLRGTNQPTPALEGEEINYWPEAEQKRLESMMDPEAAIHAYTEAMESQDWDIALHSLQDLTEWLQKGGFSPSNWLDIFLAPTAFSAFYTLDVVDIELQWRLSEAWFAAYEFMRAKEVTRAPK